MFDQIYTGIIFSYGKCIGLYLSGPEDIYIAVSHTARGNQTHGME